MIWKYLKCIEDLLKHLEPTSLTSHSFFAGWLFSGSTPRGGRGFFHVCAFWQYTCWTLLPTVRWRYRRHVAQLCCWRLATLTGRGVWGGGGGDDNVPFDCKMTLPKTRCPTLLLTSCYLDREGGGGVGGGDDNVPFDCKMTLPKTRCPTLLGSFTTYIYQNACFYIHVCLHVYIYIYIYICV